MNTQSSFDRTLLVPIGVGVFSLLGMCAILVAGRMNALRATVEEVPTATAFQYALIGTEPAIVTPTMQDMENTFPAPVEPPTGFDTPSFPTLEILSPVAPGASTDTVVRTNTPVRLSTSTSAALTSAPVTSTNTATLTPTSASAAPLGAGIFDDLDSRLVYSGTWTRQSGVPGAYQSTLHISENVTNSVTFRFIGQELRVFFQAGPSLGVIRLNLDGSNYDMNQSNASTQIYEWVLPNVSNSTHTVTISHLSGGSVNLDYIIIPDVPPTPTRTATSINQ